MNVSYDEIKTAVEDAGFFTSRMPFDDGGERLVCANRATEHGLSGNSFWLAKIESVWTLGVWGGQEYEITEPQRISEMAVDWLANTGAETKADIDAWLGEKYHLNVVDDKNS